MRKGIVFLLFCFLSGIRADISLFLPEKRELVAGYISVPKERPIDNGTYLYIKYALEDFAKKRVDFVLLDLNTPGGEVFSSLGIVEELRKIDREYQIPVIALVDDWALSAGALLAYSCRYIGTSSFGSMGAAEPILVSEGGESKAASEKTVSVLRTEFAKTAALYGRNSLIAEAMVDKDILLVRRGKEILSLRSESDEKPGDILITGKGKLLTLDATGMEEFGIADFLVPAGIPLSGRELLQKETAFDRPIQWEIYENPNIAFFSFITRPIISSICMFVLMIGVYGWIRNPASIGSMIMTLGSLCVIGIASFAVELAGVLPSVFVLLGLLLLGIDVLCLATGFLSLLGFFLLFGAAIAMLLPVWGRGQGFLPDFPSGIVIEETLYRIGLFLTAILAGLITCLVAGRLLWRKNGFLVKHLVLQEKSSEIPEERKLPAVGSAGITISSLRPLGKIRIGEEVYEAEAEAEAIETGKKVVVCDTSKRVLTVRENAD